MKSATELYQRLKAYPTNRAITFKGILDEFPRLRQRVVSPCDHQCMQKPQQAVLVAMHLVNDDGMPKQSLRSGFEVSNVWSRRVQKVRVISLSQDVQRAKILRHGNKSQT